MIAIIAIVMLFLYGCGTPKSVGKGYLVSVDSDKKSDIQKYTSIASVDSIIKNQFSYAVTGVITESIFIEDHCFMIGTESNFIYVEEKNRVEKANGKIKFKTIKK